MRHVYRTDWDNNVIVVKEPSPDIPTFVALIVVSSAWALGCIYGILTADPTLPNYPVNVFKFSVGIAIFGWVAYQSFWRCAPSELTIDVTRESYSYRHGYWFGWKELQGPLTDIAKLTIERVPVRNSRRWRRWIEWNVKRPDFYAGTFPDRESATDKWKTLANRIGAPFGCR